MRYVFVQNLSRPLETPIRALVCETFLCRLRGLTFRRDIPINQGLLLVQNQDSRLDASIHMMGVFTDLSVVWINSQREVVDIRQARRWHPLYIPRRPAKYILELSPERWSDFQIGDQVNFEEDAAF